MAKHRRFWRNMRKHSMRTRTTFCSHGFQIPGKPEPWTIPAAKGGAEIKASRFCLQCWEKHGEVFLAHRYTHIVSEDPCQYGFLNLIQYVLKDRAWYRDQDRYEFLETELRMHLLEKREYIEKALHEQTSSGYNQYVRQVLCAKLRDLQKHNNTEFQITINSESYGDVQEERPSDFNPDDENERLARVADAVTESGEAASIRRLWVQALSGSLSLKKNSSLPAIL
jgi:hypothetical protein